MIGGLVAAYDLTNNIGLLHKVVDLTQRIMPAFNTPSGIPCNAVCLPDGQTSCGEAHGTNLAEAGTLFLVWERWVFVVGLLWVCCRFVWRVLQMVVHGYITRHYTTLTYTHTFSLSFTHAHPLFSSRFFSLFFSLTGVLHVE